jgi:hypothetical protein
VSSTASRPAKSSARGQSNIDAIIYAGTATPA